MTAWRARPRLSSLVACACTSSGPSITLEAPSTTTTAPAGTATVDRPESVEPTLVVDIADASIDISPLILGVSGDADGEYVRDSGITLLNWGGENVSRFNYLVGNASNRGVDWQLPEPSGWFDGGSGERSPRVGVRRGDRRPHCRPDPGLGGLRRRSGDLLVPTRWRWVRERGGRELSDSGCQRRSSEYQRRQQLEGGRGRGLGTSSSDPATTPRFIAFDNEPELWGITHHDVHPDVHDV